MTKRKLRDQFKLAYSILGCRLYIPHPILYLSKNELHKIINSDFERRKTKLEIPLSHGLLFLYYIMIGIFAICSIIVLDL